jgi:uncharacterized protein YegJ (DUF2314 family)
MKPLDFRRKPLERIAGQKVYDIHDDTPDYKFLVGKLVKVRTSGERFWVKVLVYGGETIYGRVENHLVGDHSYKYGDLISFTIGDICDVVRHFDHSR